VRKKIFITGASGCVGHYLFDELANLPDTELILLVRNPAKLKFDPRQYPNVTLIVDDLKNIASHAAVVQQADQVVHLAADWGGNEGNYDYTLSFFQLLDPAKCRKVIYFSTASILGQDNKVTDAAEKFGTHYIRSKYRIYKKLPELKMAGKIITLFPTWVIGGDAKHPYSHAAEGIVGIKPWLKLVRFFTVDASFHFIHARDMARMTKYLLDNDLPAKEYVLGNAPLTAGELIKQICNYWGVKVFWQLPIGLPLVQFLARVTGRKFHPWDLYCLNHRHFVYRTVNAASFGLSGGLETVAALLRSFRTSA